MGSIGEVASMVIRVGLMQAKRPGIVTIGMLVLMGRRRGEARQVLSLVIADW